MSEREFSLSFPTSDPTVIYYLDSEMCQGRRLYWPMVDLDYDVVHLDVGGQHFYTEDFQEALLAIFADADNKEVTLLHAKTGELFACRSHTR